MTTEVTSELRVYMRHVRAAKLCADGLKTFFDKYGLDLRAFCHSGIEANKLREIGNVFGLRAVAEAEKESTDGRG